MSDGGTAFHAPAFTKRRQENNAGDEKVAFITRIVLSPLSGCLT